ncbi:MAG: hypothetical protein PVH30_09355 [Desulfobacterales bacterium]|jgi:hypothetical protein
MTVGKKDFPDLFEDTPIDPMGTATGTRPPASSVHGAPTHRTGPEKKKAGFYLSIDLIGRFDRKYHELKLEGRLIPNKSGLLEAALAFALDDMDKGEDSLILRHVDRSSSVFDKGES